MELQSRPRTILSDEEIIALYWDRDESAIAQTDIKYKKFLLSVAYNIVFDDQDCEECLNDTYIDAWNSMPPSKPALLQAFLATIMRRTAIDRYKSRKRQKRIASELTVFAWTTIIFATSALWRSCAVISAASSPQMMRGIVRAFAIS